MSTLPSVTFFTVLIITVLWSFIKNKTPPIWFPHPYKQRPKTRLTMFPRLTELQGSDAKSLAAEDMASPVAWTSCTASIMSRWISGFSAAICWPRSTKLAVAFSTAATKTCARLDLPFFFCGDLEETRVVTCKEKRYQNRYARVFTFTIYYITSIVSRVQLAMQLFKNKWVTVCTRHSLAACTLKNWISVKKRGDSTNGC